MLWLRFPLDFHAKPNFTFFISACQIKPQEQDQFKKKAGTTIESNCVVMFIIFLLIVLKGSVSPSMSLTGDKNPETKQV